MKPIVRLPLFAAASVVATLACHGAAQAQAFYLQEQSARGAGRAFSGEAADTGAASLWWNPAASAGMTEAEIAASASLILPAGEVVDTGTLIARPGQPPTTVGGLPVSTNPIEDGLLPSGSIAYPITDRLSVGLTLASPFSFTTEYADASWARYTADRTRLRTYDVQPSLAYAPARWLRLGAALNAEYAEATLSNKLPQLAAGLPDGDQSLQGDGWDFGWSVGAQIVGGPVTLGLAYKSFGEDLVLGADTDSAPITYVPATLSWRGDWSGESAQTDLTFSTTLGIRGLGDGLERFMLKRLYARDGFFIVKLDAGRTQDFGPGLQLYSRFTGQWSPDPLISNEGFSLGGMASVRGYYESEAIADYGFALQTELRSPDFASALGAGLLNELRLHAFLDSGWAALHRTAPGQESDFSLVRAGLGARLKLFNFFTGALDVGVPLTSGPDSESGDIFARFRIQGEF